MTIEARLWPVIDAAAALLAARENQMITSEEWDALAKAVDACRKPESSERTENNAVFSVDRRSGDLIESVTPRRGKPYTHRCTKPVLEMVCSAFDDPAMYQSGATIVEMAQRLGAPHTQVAVAFHFLFERGIIDRDRRRIYSDSSDVSLDGMLEYQALREKGPAT